MRQATVVTAVIAALAVVGAGPALAQGTPPTMVESYDSIADTILAVRQMEADFVRALLDGHRHAAEAYYKRGEFDKAAAEIALFANEGDNAVGGVRKRLIEGGHHHNAAGEEQGVFEPGFVIVTRQAKQQALAAASALQRSGTEEARQEAWEKFAALARELLSTDG